MMRLLPGVFLFSAVMSEETRRLSAFVMPGAQVGVSSHAAQHIRATEMASQHIGAVEDAGSWNAAAGHSVSLAAEGKKSGEKGTKLVSKKTLKRQLRKMVKKGAKVEKKLKNLKKACKGRRRAFVPFWINESGTAHDPDAPMASMFSEIHVGSPSQYVTSAFAEVESYEEAEANIKGMFNGKSKDYLYQQLDAIDLDIQEMKRKYKKLAKKCGY